MILTVLPLVAFQQTATANLSTPSLLAQVAADTVRVSGFARLAASDREGALDSKVLGDAKPVRMAGWDVRGMRAYRVGEMYLWVDPVSGLVTTLEGGSDHSLDRICRPRSDSSGNPRVMPVPRKVSDGEAIKLATHYFAATGRSYPVQILEVRDGAGGNGDDIALTLQPSYRGVPFAAYVQIEIDRESGRLDSFSLFRELPTPPPNVTPVASKEEAHYIALRAAALAGRAVRDLPMPYIRLSIVRLDATPNQTATYNFNQRDREDAEMGRARLVYDIRIRGTWDKALYTVLLDAKDGRLLQVHRNRTYNFDTKDVAPGASEVSRGAQTWRVAVDDAPWSKLAIDTLSPAPAEGFAGSRTVLLTDGRSAFQASYDPATGRIGIEGADKKTAVYRPGPALADLLKKGAAPSPPLGDKAGAASRT